MSDPVFLSIVIPAYREERRLGETLERIEAFRRTRPWTSEVVIVDDGSPDGTSRVAEAFMRGKEGYRLLRREFNLGKGAAVHRGMTQAHGRFRLFTDADLSTPIEEVEKFFPYLEGRGDDGVRYDGIIGSRRVTGSNLEKRQPIHRELSGWIFNVLVRALVLRGYQDTQCGFKMFTAEATKEIFSRQHILGFGFDVELLFIATRVLGLNIKEAPVRWIDSPASTVRLLDDSTRMFADLVKIRRNHRNGKYRPKNPR